MISILTNMASMSASYNLNNTHSNLQKSLTRLSSGKRINSSVDDAGGLAVSMKLSAAIRRTEATKIGVSNAMSLLQVQDGALKSAASILTRMSELATLATDVTKTTNDTALYQTELNALTDSLSSMLSVEFNGTAVFTAGGASLGVVVTEDGGTVGITRTDLDNLVNTTISGIDISSSSAQATAAVATLDTAIQELATYRATNGAEQQRLSFAIDMLEVNQANLEAAHGRIVDVDIASESANLARQNILYQAGTAILAQANQSGQSVLRLIS
jgi:flagellin